MDLLGEEGGGSGKTVHVEKVTSQSFEPSKVSSPTPRSYGAYSSRSDSSARFPAKGGQPLRHPSPPNVPPDIQLGAEEEVQQEQYVLQLLRRASQTIRDERAHSLQLKKELVQLKQLDITPEGVERLKAENRFLKDKVTFLCGGLSGGSLFGVSDKYLGGIECSRRRNQRPPRTPTPSARGRYATPVRQTVGGSPIHRESVKRGAESGSCTCHSASSRLPSGQRKSTGDRSALTALWATAPCEGKAVKYTVEMITRLRRAMAPPPTEEQLGEVIHAMVREIVREARRRGMGLGMKKQRPCVYECTYFPKREKKVGCKVTRLVHLSIDSGQLTVKVGGGHVNFLDYLGRRCNCHLVP